VIGTEIAGKLAVATAWGRQHYVLLSDQHDGQKTLLPELSILWGRLGHISIGSHIWIGRGDRVKTKGGNAWTFDVVVYPDEGRVYDNPRPDALKPQSRDARRGADESNAPMGEVGADAAQDELPI